MTKTSFASLLGTITLTEEGGCITGLRFGGKIQRSTSATKILREAHEQLHEYFRGKRESFEIPLAIDGTAFDLRVWNAMREIPFGSVRTYGELAKAIGKPKAYRAVANACGRNRVPILIPCHRVVASNGLGGFSAGIRRKKKLLNIEAKELSKLQRFNPGDMRMDDAHIRDIETIGD